MDKLWLYHLHYFEDLIAEDGERRNAWHRRLIDRWVRDNAPFSGNCWEPYPVSLRIGNWIKWALTGNGMEQAWLRSLALQAEYLYRRVEWHLLGNHVFENAKALVLAGSFFEGTLADKWRNRGLWILDRQLEEQILKDGGHIERSPMYHCVVLEGLLDLVQISSHYGLNEDRIPRWKARAGDMLRWLAAMVHPDGGIPFFNDAVFDATLSPDKLAGYSRDLEVDGLETTDGEGLMLLEESGYVRAARGPIVALLDIAPLGPDYQPGHGHADTLSFELSMYGRRVLVNAGTGVYGDGRERLIQRSTAAHNTVEVDGRNSSEVWSGFRVARRAQPFDISIRGTGAAWQVRASHDGYRRLPGRVTHRRTWVFTESGLTVEDEVLGSHDRAVAFFHFHPDVAVRLGDSRGVIRFKDGNEIEFSIESGPSRLVETEYHPEFGKSERALCLEIRLKDSKAMFRLAFPRQG